MAQSQDVYGLLTDLCGDKIVEVTNPREFRENIEAAGRFPTLIVTKNISPIPNNSLRVASFVKHCEKHEDRAIT